MTNSMVDGIIDEVVETLEDKEVEAETEERRELLQVS